MLSKLLLLLQYVKWQTITDRTDEVSVISVGNKKPPQFCNFAGFIHSVGNVHRKTLSASFTQSVE